MLQKVFSSFIDHLNYFNSFVAQKSVVVVDNLINDQMMLLIQHKEMDVQMRLVNDEIISTIKYC